MRNLRALLSTAILLVLIAAPSIYAHHGNAAYDTKHKVTLTGTVTELSLANPHSMIAFDVKDQQGNVSHWVVEFGVLRDLVASGWTSDTLKPGDQIKLTVYPKRDGDPGGIFAGGVITYADGRPVPLNPPQQTAHRPPIRW